MLLKNISFGTVTIQAVVSDKKSFVKKRFAVVDLLDCPVDEELIYI